MKHLLLIVFVFTLSALCAEADIQVTYTGFTAEQQTAFDYAMSLWEPLLNSTVPIKVNARFQNLPGFVSAPISNLIKNFPGAPQQNVWYPTALANAITGVEQNPGETDIDFIVSSSTSNVWYYGTDPACPDNAIDFVTEMHKGLTYGLGYMTSFYVLTGYGSYGMLNPSVLGITTSFPWENMNSQPFIYDTHVYNSQGLQLTNTANFANPSTALNAQLTGGNLRYVGEYGNSFSDHQLTILYAGTFGIARTARLDANTYNGTQNAPGVPTAYSGDVFRYPAPIVLGILKDLGWSTNEELLCPPPDSLSVVVDSDTVNLTWDAPSTPYTIIAYAVHRDSDEFTEQTSLQFTDYAVPAGTHYYSVKALYSMGWSPYTAEVEALVSVGVNDEVQPPMPAISLNTYPNPGHGNCHIALQLKEASSLKLEVYNVKGQLVSRIPERMYAAGTHDVQWNSLDLAGQPLSSGLYLVRCTGNYASATTRMMLIK